MTTTAVETSSTKKHLTQALNDPAMMSCSVIHQAHKATLHEIDFPALAEDLCEQIDRISSGDLSQLEAMLFSQASALQAIFTKASTQAINAAHIGQLQAWGTLAMKSQNQCRQTLIALKELRRPTHPTMFVKQQNNLLNQQINTSDPIALQTPELGFAEKSNFENELLRGVSNARLEPTREITAVTVDSSMATMEKINRTEDCSR